MFKMHVVHIGVTFLLVSPSALGVVVTFEEPALEEAVRAALGKPVGDIMDTETATILELELAFTSVPSGALPLTGIEYCTSLETLTCCFDAPGLADEQIGARLSEISAVTSLRSLTVTGAVSAGGCSLRLYAVLGTAVDVSPLATLTNLEYLMLFVSAADISPLSTLSSLTTFISSAATAELVADIATLTQVHVLKLPYLFWDTADQMAPLAGMTGLRDLMIEWVKPALDTESLPTVPQVEILQVCLAGDFSHWIPADFVAAFPGVRVLTLGRPCSDENYCLLSDYSALGNLANLEGTTFHRPPAVDLSFVATLDNLSGLSFLGGDDSQFEAGGQDFAALVTLLTDSPRAFRLVVEDTYLSDTACSEQLPALFQMPDVTLEGDFMNCIGLPGEGEGEGEGEPPTGPHTADGNGDCRIDLPELLRVIQFYNMGGFHCAANPGDTEDGYVAGPGENHTCAPHASDYLNGPGWTITLSELLRLIQFFNIGGYHLCPGDGTQDGYCAGLS